MRLAQAGGLDLSTGLDYIIKSTNAAKISFGELENWIDEWTYSANSSAGTVEEFGEAMLKMGATMRFADNKEELLAMLATLHDAGTTGSNAGTLLRNSMIRLVAPTKKASDAMAELGVSQSDIDEALAETNGDMKKAQKLLEDTGFSAYRSNGQLKDFAEIFEDLNVATKSMSEEDRFAVWSAIFPTRSITGAMALIEAADNNWNGLLDDLNSGKATGYGEYAADTMMSGLTGSIETFNSKVEDLRKELGNQLAPQLENIYENFGKVIDLLRAGGQDNGVSSGLDWLSSASDVIGGLADNMDGMDPAVFDALVAGLGTLAAIGPTLLTAGIAIRTIGWGMSVFTSTPIGKIILAAGAIGIIATALDKYNEARYKSNFGDLRIDTTGLDENMQQLKDAFEKATAPTEQFAKALDDCVTNYNTAAQTLSATMMEDLLKDQTLTGDKLDKKLQEYRTLGSDMVGALKEGITTSADMSAEFWAALFKGKNDTDEDVAKNEIFAGIIKALDEEKGDAIEKAEEIGNALQAAINKAWEDGHLDPEEQEKIRNYIKEMNQIAVEAEREEQEKQNYIKRRRMLDKTQGMSYEQMVEYENNTIIPQRQAELDYWEDNYKAQIAGMNWDIDQLKAKQKEAYNNGDLETVQKIQKDIDDKTRLIAGSEAAYQKKIAETYGNYDDLIMPWRRTTGTDSGIGTEYLIEAANMLISGQLTDLNELRRYVGNKGTNFVDASRYYGELVTLLGGTEAMQTRLAMYQQNGDTTSAKQMEQILAIWSILENSTENTGIELQNRELSASEYESFYRNSGLMENVKAYMKALLDEDIASQTANEMYSNIASTPRAYLEGMIQAFGEMYNTDMIYALFGEGRDLGPQQIDDFALATLLGLSSTDRKELEKGGLVDSLYNYAQAKQAYDEAYSHLEYQGQIRGTADEIANLFELESKVNIAEQAVAEAMAGRDGAQEVFSEPLQAVVNFTYKFPAIGGLLSLIGLDIPHEAKGGRETRPAIFAEAGIPEWYIPEEHTENTARLILAAAANSGFSFIDLAEYAGAQLFAQGGTDGSGSLSWASLSGESGSSGAGDSGDITVHYSPVIHSENADGVERKLKEDKKRFRKFFEEFMEERELYRNMAAYQ